jgi:hypothetical protein
VAGGGEQPAKDLGFEYADGNFLQMGIDPREDYSNGRIAQDIAEARRCSNSFNTLPANMTVPKYRQLTYAAFGTTTIPLTLTLLS